LGLVAAFIFLACGALRLARFNVSAGHRDPGFFQGLPIPGGAAVLTAAVLWHHRWPDRVIQPNGAWILLLILALAFLMVSNLDFVSLKNKIFIKNKHPFETLVGFIILLAFVIMKAKTVLLPIGFAYLASGPVVTVVRRMRRQEPAFAQDGGASQEPGETRDGASESDGGD
ncbi:MAG: hypothetical protein LBE49_00850, partial [Deltaproteobacteria bacterium]|nr:hypothetical protein [Deltaproteobacteria bacterium]